MILEPVIGLEVHAQLKTKSKLFSGSATIYGAEPNSQTSFIDAGFPGVLPVLNGEAVIMAIRFGLAIQAEIQGICYFERKNYFYPDLPKGYQISQFEKPIIRDGCLSIRLPDNTDKKIPIVRAHLEEDAGKSLHEAHPLYSGIDLNRAGTPLLEIVTAPCLFSAEEAVIYLKTLHELLRFLDICDGNMQEGSFRCDVNISLRPKGSDALGTRVELKNLNSFRYIEKAILHEQLRQQNVLQSGQFVRQETRLYSPVTDSTYPLRGKEREEDYRYFPEPDLLPVHLSKEDIAHIQESMPELPAQIRARLREIEEFSSDDIEFLLSSPELIHFFDSVVKQTAASLKTVVNWLKGPYAEALNETNGSFAYPPVSANQLGSLLDKLSSQIINHKTARTIFSQLLTSKQTIDELIALHGYEQTMKQSELEAAIHEVLNQFPEQVALYRAGKDKLLAFFVGQVMKQTRGKGDPSLVNKLLRNYLK